ncbi:MAG: UbiA family prenyltransferase [Opitutales bacterium]
MSSPLHTHLRLARASNLPTTWSNVLCALLLAGGFQWPVFFGAVFAISLFYIAGMYLNDWRDAEHDRAHRPERPIPSGVISRQAVFLYAAVYFGLGLALSLWMESRSVFWTLGLIGCITLYDLDHKDNSMSPWIMAACRALIYPWAASLAGQALPVEIWIAAAAAYSYTLGLTYIARGADAAPILKLLLLACLILPALLWGSRMGETVFVWSLPALVLFLAWVGYCLSTWLRPSTGSGPPIGKLIAGLCLVDLVAISVATPISVAILLLLAFFFISTLQFQKIISGT